MKKESSLNPFNIWGSYVGALVAFLVLYYLVVSGFKGDNITIILFFPLALIGFFFGKLNLSMFILAFILQFIYGFLIGWGIHSAVRAIRK